MSRLVTFFLSFLAFNTAMAETATSAAGQYQGPSPLGNGLFFGAMIAIFYFLIWRPQSKRAKAHRTLLSGLAKGDEVVTSGGILGKVTKVEDSFVSIMISDSTEIMVQKGAITQAMPKGTMKSQ